MAFYAIEDGTHTPKRYVESIDKVAGTFTITTTIANVLEYTVQATAQTDATYLSNLVGSERFHVGASPKPH